MAQLCLPAIPADYDYEPVVLCGIGELGVREVVAAGRAFFDKYEATGQTSEENSEEEDSRSDSPRIHRTESRRNKKKEQFGGNALRLSNLVREENLYALLGVGEGCSPDEIKKSYRKLVLEKHPDKLPEGEREKGRSDFLKIQEAFEVLSVDRNRWMYDSSLPFDDSIPTWEEGDDFFETFTNAFDRNARWSVVRPVPTLGTSTTSKSEIDKFYDFWYSFESWRDFSHHDEYDLSHAESRDERRWMEVQNGRIRKKKIQEEISRIRKLVDTSFKADPRIRAFKQAEADLIAEQKRQKQAQKEAREKEEEMKRIERQLELELEAERAKNEKNQIKQIRGQIRQTLGLLPGSREEGETTAGGGMYTKLEKFNNALIKLLVDLKSAQDMLRRAQDSADAADGFMDAVIDEAFPKRVETVERSPQVVQQDVVQVSTEWTPEEIQLLTRGMQKYPVGTNKRWEVIQGLIGGSKSVSQVIEMSKIVASKKVFESAGVVTKKAVAPVVSAPDIDYERLASKAAEEWSPEQQKQLEEGMKKFPASLPAAERWAKIAEHVDGKTKQQCVARFKYIRELIALKKK